MAQTLQLHFRMNKFVNEPLINKLKRLILFKDYSAHLEPSKKRLKS